MRYVVSTIKGKKTKDISDENKSTCRDSGPAEVRHQGSKKNQFLVSVKRKQLVFLFKAINVGVLERQLSGRGVFKLEHWSFSEAKGSWTNPPL